MNVFPAGALLLLALGAPLAEAVDRGIYTVVEGVARVLRATTWYRLEPGTRVESGDVVDAAERGTGGAAKRLASQAYGSGSVDRCARPRAAPDRAGVHRPDDLAACRVPGAVAKVVARNAARQARDADEFVQLVAEHIGTQERNAFLHELAGE
jgi:hypothetical protein